MTELIRVGRVVPLSESDKVEYRARLLPRRSSGRMLAEGFLGTYRVLLWRPARYLMFPGDSRPVH